MRQIWAAIALAAAASVAAAQEPEMQAKLEEKLAKEFVSKAAWELDFDKARAKAKETGKLIFAYFTRSYAP